MKATLRILCFVICLFFLLSLFACGIQQPAATKDEETSVSPPSEAPDMTSVHGYFDPDDNGQLFFRGQAYYQIFTADYSQLILDDLMEGRAYITMPEVTDDEQAKEEGTVIQFSTSQELPDILMMTVADYFRLHDENYDPDLYPEYQYYCKREESESRYRKLQTRAFNNMYITNWEHMDDSKTPEQYFSLGSHDMLDDDTAEAIRATLKDESAESFPIDDLEKGGFIMLAVHRCDKNMLVDPMTDEYLIIKTTDGRYYIHNWYSDGLFLRVSGENEAVISAFIDQYPVTSLLYTRLFTEQYIDHADEAGASAA